ncbi:hypothetical protein [Salinibacter ruber]|uniref:hypothetical protein n=1 Tax=Salinibacter ruber TaxID=146919 RepID=UPI00207329C3|nr:hypothetical protein [Salinibacter ruber]
MDLAYPSVLKRPRSIQEAAGQGERTRLPGEAPKDGTPEDGLPDPEVEADEMYHAEISADAGEKSDPHRNLGDRPRQGANKAFRRGTYQNDRPPVLRMVGRETGRACFRACVDTKEETIRTAVSRKTAEEACIFTDENRSCLWLENEEESRSRKAVDHSEGWATGQDGDGIREFHFTKTTEGDGVKLDLTWEFLCLS